MAAATGIIVIEATGQAGGSETTDSAGVARHFPRCWLSLLLMLPYAAQVPQQTGVLPKQT
jgi:hypothetical protein